MIRIINYFKFDLFFRTSLAPYVFSLAAPVSMGPHVDEHSKRSRFPTTIPLSIDIKKVQSFIYQGLLDVLFFFNF